jgi:glycosyltransferase involved in cell wall biosynthesis
VERLPPMRILHVLSTSQRRGAEAFALQLNRALRERGHDSQAVALTPSSSGQQFAVEVLAARRSDARGLRALRHRGRAADVVIAHGGSTLPACALGLVGLDVPFVYVNIGDPRHWAAAWSRRIRAGLLLKRAAAVASVSPLGREALISHYRLPPSRICVIPNGRSADRYFPADAVGRGRARRELGLPTDGDLVAIVAALNPEKRIDVAIEAVSRLADAHLVIVGDGPEASGLRTLAAARAPGQIRFLGSVDDARAVLAAADACLLTSDSEGVPGVLIEAGMMAVPIVATDVGFVRDVVQDQVTGRLVPARDPASTATALTAVLRDRERLGHAARQHCLRHFEMESVTQRWELLLTQVIRMSTPARTGTR